jgi:hypothetical protein
MADYDAIGTVSEALIDRLRSEIQDRDVLSLGRNEIALTSPDAVGSDSDTRLSLYLFKIGRSDQRQSRRITADGVRKGSPLPLELHYLLTAYPSTAGADATANNRDQHSVLGLAMQVLYDNATLAADELGPSFHDETELQITMDSDSDSTVARVWDTFRDVPRYPSVAYEVGPVLLDSLREEKVERVSDRETNINKHERPPVRPDDDGATDTFRDERN